MSPQSPLPPLEPDQRVELRRRVAVAVLREKQRVRRVLFTASIAMALIFTGLTLVIGADPTISANFFVPNSDASAVTILPLIGMVVLLMMQMIGVVIDTRGGEREIRERMLKQELNRMLMSDAIGGDLLDDDLDTHLDVPSKRKRQADTDPDHYRLSDDGELIPADDTDSLDEIAPRRRAAR